MSRFKKVFEGAQQLSLGISVVVAVLLGVGLGLGLRKLFGYDWLLWLGVFYGVLAAGLNIKKAYDALKKELDELALDPKYSAKTKGAEGVDLERRDKELSFEKDLTLSKDPLPSKHGSKNYASNADQDLRASQDLARGADLDATKNPKRQYLSQNRDLDASSLTKAKDPSFEKDLTPGKDLAEGADLERRDLAQAQNQSAVQKTLDRGALE